MIDAAQVGLRHEPPAAEREADADLFALGREAAAAAHRATGGRVIFARARQLLATGAWRGPRDAADAYVEAEDLEALGLGAARMAGARTVLSRWADRETSNGEALLNAAREGGMRVLLRLRFAAGEPEGLRLARLAALAARIRAGLPADGVLPTPEGEPLGLDTLRFVALCRLRVGVPAVLADFGRWGPRLAQMALGFGASELFGPIVAERALRLGDNAHNPSMTRKEAALLVRAAGLRPYERLSGGALWPWDEEPTP